MSESNQPPSRRAAELRPAEVCRRLLEALDASEGRRRKRKRDTTPDQAGLAIKRGLLEAAVAADPDPERFEAWLIESASRAGEANSGGFFAMARSILEEWQLARASPRFRAWLAGGAPSDDR